MNETRGIWLSLNEICHQIQKIHVEVN